MTETPSGGPDPGRKVYINGRFLDQPLSGVQRYAREMVGALDVLLASEPSSHEQWCLLTSGKAQEDLGLKHIDVRSLPSRLTGHAWEQAVLPRASRDGLLLGFGGSGPLLQSRQLVVIHDAAVFRRPDLFRPAYAAWHRLIGRALAKCAQIATVSQFSRNELADIFKRDAASIPVFPNGADHMLRVAGCDEIRDHLQVSGEPYFVLLGNFTKNKNAAVALAALERVRGAKLVLIGARRNIFASPELDDLGDRTIFAGRVDDAEVAGLLQGATALIFPSLYEGFGIPPLEAMVLGCPVIASNIPAVREACGNAAAYFDPLDAEDLSRRMQESLAETSAERAARNSRAVARAATFTWERSAKELLAFCRATLLRSGAEA